MLRYMRAPTVCCVLNFRHLRFEFVSDFVLRISDFEDITDFRVAPQETLFFLKNRLSHGENGRYMPSINPRRPTNLWFRLKLPLRCPNHDGSPVRPKSGEFFPKVVDIVRKTCFHM